MNFLKNALLTGLYVLLPLMLLWIGIKEIAGLLVEMATPIADMFPTEYFDEPRWPGILATLIIIGTSILVGLFARLPFVGKAAHSFEAGVLYKVPMYRMLKLISSSLVRAEEKNVRPAIISDGKGGGDPCYVMEEHESGLATVLLPWSPASFAGSIRVVHGSELMYLDCTFDEYSRSISLMGVGIAECMQETEERAAQSNQEASP